MDEPGQKLKRAREQLNLRFRDVEDASKKIATRHNNDEFVILISRLSEIENRNTVPSIYRLYSLCTIYCLDPYDVLEWYGVKISSQASDAISIEMTATRPVRFAGRSYADVQVPLSLNPGFDFRKTEFLSQMIQRWGPLSASLLSEADGKHLRFAFMGRDDESMYPLIRPESLLLIDDGQRKIASGGWTDDSDRPIYLIEHRSGYFVGWCMVNEKHFIVMPHPSCPCPPQIFLPDEVDVLGRVTGVAMLLTPAKRRNTPT